MDFENELGINNLNEPTKESSEVPQEIRGGGYSGNPGKKPRGRAKGYKRSPESIAKQRETRWWRDSS